VVSSESWLCAKRLSAGEIEVILESNSEAYSEEENDSAGSSTNHQQDEEEEQEGRQQQQQQNQRPQSASKWRLPTHKQPSTPQIFLLFAHASVVM
jgi:hypothetical protein